MTPVEERIRALREALARPLPGWAAQQVAWPRPGRPAGLDSDGTLRAAAVLIALSPAVTSRTNAASIMVPAPPVAPRFSFPLIRRRDDMRHHPGQISLPGGECGPGEDACRCALREAEEEIGMAAESVQVLGFLTPIPVPVSGYRIQPVVGWVEAPPRWTLEAREVDAILTADPDLLLAEGPRGVVRREREGGAIEAPAYVVAGEGGGEALVWGATAIILAEFLSVWGGQTTRP